jgi:hypothetical protein
MYSEMTYIFLEAKNLKEMSGSTWSFPCLEHNMKTSLPFKAKKKNVLVLLISQVRYVIAYPFFVLELTQNDLVYTLEPAQHPGVPTLLYCENRLLSFSSIKKTNLLYTN